MAKRTVKRKKSVKSRRTSSTRTARAGAALKRVGQKTRTAAGKAAGKAKSAARKAAKTLKENKKARAAAITAAGVAVAAVAGLAARSRRKKK